MPYDLVRWGDQIIVELRPALPYPLRRIDIESAKAKIVKIDGADRVVRVFNWKGRRAALCEAEGQRYIEILDGDHVERLEVPTVFREVAMTLEPNVATDQSDLVLFNGDNFYSFDGTQWWHARMGEAPELPSYGPSQLMLHQGFLYLAFDRGEWGGSLWKANPRNGVMTAVFPHGLPVRDLTIAPDGRLWAVRGLAHLGGLDGILSVYTGEQWLTVAKSELIRWPGEAAILDCYDALSFDNRGEALLLTSRLGLLAQSASWRPLVPDLPKQEMRGEDIELVGGTLVVSSRTKEVMLYDVSRATTRFVPLVF